MEEQGESHKAGYLLLLPSTQCTSLFREEDRGEAKMRSIWPCPWNPSSPQPNARAAPPLFPMHIWTRPPGTWKQGWPMACSHCALLGGATKWGYGECLSHRAVLHYNPQFADEETEAQSRKVLAQSLRLTLGYFTEGLTCRQGCSREHSPEQFNQFLCCRMPQPGALQGAKWACNESQLFSHGNFKGKCSIEHTLGNTKADPGREHPS